MPDDVVEDTKRNEARKRPVSRRNGRVIESEIKTFYKTEPTATDKRNGLELNLPKWKGT